MPSVLRPVPPPIRRWTRWPRWLRALDGAAAWLAAWLGLLAALPAGDPGDLIVLAALLAALLAVVPGVRRAWRPVTGAVGLGVSRGLRAGDRVWVVRPGQAEPAVVTARRGWRVVLARSGAPAEGVRVRRTRVLLVPADHPRGDRVRPRP